MFNQLKNRLSFLVLEQCKGFVVRVVQIACMSVALFVHLGAQTTPVVTPPAAAPLTAPIAGDAPSLPKAKQVYELHAVRFVIQSDSGDVLKISDNELLGIVASKPGNPSVSNRILHYFNKEFQRNSSVPDFVRSAVGRLAAATDSIENESRSFDRTTANFDAFRLQDYFLQIGYHDAVVRYNFHVSADAENNVLTFFIRPGRRYIVDALTYYGLDSVAADVRPKVFAVADSLKGQPFTESAIRFQLAKMVQVLRNNGYAKAAFPKIAEPNPKPRNEKDSIRWIDQMPLVYGDTIRKADSISVFLAPGQRYRMGSIHFVDSLNGQPIVTDEVKRRQMEYNPREWYDQSAVDRSVANLIALGTFDRIAIDTLSLPSGGNTMNTTIFSQYRQAWDLTFAIGPSRSLLNSLLNLGGEINYLHRNVSNHADILNLYARGTMQDIVTWWDRFKEKPFPKSWTEAWQSILYEYEVGAAYTRQDFFRLFDRKVNFTAQAALKQQNIADPFKMKGGDIHLTLALPLPTYTFVNRIVFDVSFNLASTSGYDAAKAAAVQNKDSVQKARILEQLALYEVLNNRAKDGLKSVSTILSLSLNSEHRDNIFAPRSGYAVNSGIDWGIPGAGIADYLRVQASLLAFLPSGNLSSWAGKLRFGHIWWYDRENSLVPFDRHFFAGGANSVRSYPPQLLRDPQSGGTQGETGSLEKYVGVASLLELSAEYRYSFPRYQNIGEFWGDQISRLGVTFFSDIGNGFNRLTKESYGKATWTDILLRFNYAWGVGAGIRYMLPVGPFRLDFGFRLYDPTRTEIERRWLFKRVMLSSESLYISISLGHAF